jgi:hypothetical protein
LIVVPFLILCFVGSGRSVAAETQAASDSTNHTSPTFNKDIAPVVFAHCSGCHRPGESAPFSLLTYQDVHKHAKQIAEAVAKRYMPPWLPEKGHGDFADDRSLPTEQIELIQHWVAAGSIEGSRADLPPLPKWTFGWQLGTPDLEIKLPPFTLRAEGKDLYRNFVVPIPVSTRKYVRGVEFQPGNSKVVHHAFINIDPTRFSRRRAEKENPPGFDGMELTESARMPAGHLLGWQPGKTARMGPPGLSWPLETNTDLVLQVHFHPSGKPEQVQPALALYFTEQPPTNTAFRLNLQFFKIDIPAGKKDYVINESYTLPIDVKLLGISPHAHYLCKRMEGFALLPDGNRKDLILIKDWDFNWQGDYRYREPIWLPRGTTLSMRFSYDNSADNIRNPNQPPKQVRYGLQTTDEMGELWFQVLPSNAEQRARLEEDFYGYVVKHTLEYNQYLLAENPNDAAACMRLGTAELHLGQVQDAFKHFQLAIRSDPKCQAAFYQLGFIFQRMNRLNEAQLAYEEAVKLDPDDYQAQGSLGYVYLAKGDLERAEDRLKTAVRVNPDDEVSRRNLELVAQARANKKAE